MLVCAASACTESLPATHIDPGLCPQSPFGDFANYGCARFTAVLTTPDGAPAIGVRLSATVLYPAHLGVPGGVNSLPSDSLGRAGLQFTWWHLPPAPESAPMRVRVYRDLPRIGSELLDSLDIVARYAPVGARPPIDSVQWRLARW